MKQLFFITLLSLLCGRSGNAEENSPHGRPCAAPTGRIAYAFSGELNAGMTYELEAGPFLFRLTPEDNPSVSGGWYIRVFEGQREDDLSKFTIPYSGPNDRDVFPWFDAKGQLHNAPALRRTFYFSPEVGLSIQWEDDADKRRDNQRRIENYGRGDFDILDYRVGVAREGVPVPFAWIKFSGCLTWPE